MGFGRHVFESRDMNRHRGFTLAELMVVIAVIALLVAILMPALSGIGANARRILCINNLNKINQATQTSASRSSSDLRSMSDNWVSVVQQLTDSQDLLRCPEGGPLAEGSPVESLLCIRMRTGGLETIPLMEVFQSGGWASGYKLLKFSSTQFSQLGESKRVTPAPYVPDGNPNTYYWCYDDAGLGGDHDFQDLVVRVEKTGGGQARIQITATTGGRPEVWSPDLTIPYGVDSEINLLHGGTGVERVLNVGGGTHYGMNTASLDMREFKKLHILDYMNAQANSTDNWSDGTFDDDEDGLPDFSRHQGRLNAALLDGSARSYYRWQLDPSDLEVERVLWQD